MAGRLSRFRYLEWARGWRSERASRPPEERERFEALETAAAPPPELRSADGHLARFDESANEAVLLQAPNDGEAPSVRCVRCEAENGRFASSCSACGATFDNAEQRAFSERLWAERRAQLEEERALHSARQRAQLEDAVQAAQERRRHYEELARQVGRETRARLDGHPWEVRRQVRLNLVVGAVALGLLFISALLTGGFRAVARLLVMVALVGGVIAVRWFLRRTR